MARVMVSANRNTSACAEKRHRVLVGLRRWRKYLRVRGEEEWISSSKPLP